jgi:hypothetical protein
LIGHDGILPAQEFMETVARWADVRQVGIDRFRFVPTLCWLSTSDAFLEGLSVGGACLAALMAVGAAPILTAPVLWVAYLSLVVVCQEFLSYQWDALLLEAGFLAILLAPITWWDGCHRASDPRRVARWLLWWLLFRLMFGSGVVKLASGDPTWRGLTALVVHYETQPLPTPLAWYAAAAPLWFHRASTAAVLGIELIVPWMIFGPRRLRLSAGVVLIIFQLLIALTGNYAFFNLLTIALTVLLFDDASLGRIQRLVRLPARAAQRPHRRWPAWAAITAAIFTVPVSVVILAGQLGVRLPASDLVAPLMSALDPVRIVNPYGLFAVMTTTRPEIIVEGSNDGVRWLPYEFHDKPGDVLRRPPWVAPFQPRLDWQMWFAALGRYEQESWFQRFCLQLLVGSPPVLNLLATNPFPGKPPQFVRGVLYQYTFADETAHRLERRWWRREQLRLFSPVLSLGR